MCFWSRFIQLFHSDIQVWKTSYLLIPSVWTEMGNYHNPPFEAVYFFLNFSWYIFLSIAWHCIVDYSIIVSRIFRFIVGWLEAIWFCDVLGRTSFLLIFDTITLLFLLLLLWRSSGVFNGFSFVWRMSGIKWVQSRIFSYQKVTILMKMLNC